MPENMSDVDERVRVHVYQTLAATGRAPGRDDIARDLTLSPARAGAAINTLAAGRHLVLRDGEILLAHPFATANFGFSVMGRSTLYWGGCAWDAFAIPHLVDREPRALIATECPGCARPMAWIVDRAAPPPGDEVVHFLVPAARAWDDVIHTCTHQRVFCDHDCLRSWSRSSGLPIGTTFGIDVLWRLASRWYEGRLDSPYVRREPAEARRHFAEAGLPPGYWS
ncbi:membrane protein [Sphaerisporangium rufum]|uniref:Membrane protein n=2 Tax=Sphaerisporangium rufum TaxID=1381558 RepID=A0A919RBW9_9ACTN|nr:membrane protein [Sphaerisporangium rufum]